MNYLTKTCSANGLRIVCVLVAVTGMVVSAGCTRDHYRRQADREVYGLVDCASTDPRWPMDDFTIRPDPASRFYDPNNPNCPPMPPDDPTSHMYMQRVDGKRGWPHWHDRGNTPHVGNPSWKSYLPMDENGVVVLDREGVVRTARIHSLNYQRELESLYLSALDVSFERFRLDTQFFGGNSTFYTSDGRLRSGLSSSSLSTDTDLQMRRLFAPGGDLLVGVANSLVWQFAGPDTYGANTLLDFSLIQPLLRAGGREIVLENLTASERALLAKIRDFERFRRYFHIDVIGGSGGFRAGGYWALLRSQIEISNQVSNVAALRDSVDRYQAGYESGKEQLQSVEQARQRLYRGQSTLLRLNVSYENQLELFLLNLGLPPDLDLRFDDNSLERFNLRDPAITDARDRVEAALEPLRNPAIVELPDDFRAATASVRAECEPLLKLVERDLQALVDVLSRRSSDLELLSSRVEFERGEVDGRVADVAELNRRVVERFADFYGPDLPVVNDLVADLLTTEEDLKWFQGYKDRQQLNASGLGAEILRNLLQIESFEQDPEAFTASINAVLVQDQARNRTDTEAELLLLEQQELDKPDEDELRTPKEVLADLMGLLSSQLLEMSLVQAQARLDAVTLLPIELAPAKAFGIARLHRRDWMNARADLVDTWRQIEVRANALESSVDVTFSGDLSTTDNQPLRFRAPTGRLRVGMRFDAPLTRTEERNLYRRALINYQQARRNFYSFEDGINQSLRNLLRTIRRSQLDFEITRQSVFIAITRVDVARIDQEKPVSSQAGPRSTSGTRDLLDALDSLLVEQNSLLGAWVDYEVLRMRLDLDLGTMQLDDRGMWIDPGSITEETIGPLEPEIIPMPPPAIVPDRELTLPNPESVQSQPIEPSSPLLASPGPVGEAEHAAYLESAPDPPVITSMLLPTGTAGAYSQEP